MRHSTPHLAANTYPHTCAHAHAHTISTTLAAATTTAGNNNTNSISSSSSSRPERGGVLLADAGQHCLSVGNLFEDTLPRTPRPFLRPPLPHPLHVRQRGGNALDQRHGAGNQPRCVHQAIRGQRNALPLLGAYGTWVRTRDDECHCNTCHSYQTQTPPIPFTLRFEEKRTVVHSPALGIGGARGHALAVRCIAEVPTPKEQGHDGSHNQKPQ